MEQFKKDLITTGRPSFIPALILGIIAIISAVPELLLNSAVMIISTQHIKVLHSLTLYILWDHSPRKLLMEK